MVTLMAFVLLGLVVVAACETTRGLLQRLLSQQQAVPGDALTPNPRSVT